ncbi:hypothetical protein BH10CYA1_BH10CYA1_18240 [soil metagenome]
MKTDLLALRLAFGYTIRQRSNELISPNKNNVGSSAAVKHKKCGKSRKSGGSNGEEQRLLNGCARVDGAAYKRHHRDVLSFGLI